MQNIFYQNSVIRLLVTFSTEINTSAFVISFTIRAFVFHDNVFGSTKAKYLNMIKKNANMR
jgi:hypothetical protein